MNVLFFNHEFPQADSESGEACYRLLREYSKNPEVEVDYICASVDGKYHQLRMGENITIHRIAISEKQINLDNLSDWQMFTFAWRSYKFSLDLSQKNRYDLSHAFFAFPAGFASLMMKWRKNIPYCISLQGVMVSDSSVILKIIAKVLRNAVCIWTNDEKLKDIAMKKYPEREIKMIPMGVDTESFYPDLSERDKGLFMILCDTELVPAKGVRVLIQAMKILSGRYDNVRMIVIGDGSEKISLHDLARGLEIEKKIDFLGNIPFEQRLRYYQAADVFVLPSLERSIDDMKAIRRAVASGLPIVATDAVQEVEKLVIDQVNGFLVRRSIADDLEEKIEKLVLDENLRLLMGKRSLEIANSFSWENISKQYLNEYSKMKNLEHLKG